MTADQRFALRLFVATFTVQHRRAPTFEEIAEARGLTLAVVEAELDGYCPLIRVGASR